MITQYRYIGFTAAVLWMATGLVAQGDARRMEYLDRGLVAIRTGPNTVFLSWRLLGADSKEIAFNLIRTRDGKNPTKLNPVPITDQTCFVDTQADFSTAVGYQVSTILGGKEQPADKPLVLPADTPIQPYLTIPLKTLPRHRPGDASVGDLDGDGQYEIVLKQEMRPRDNSGSGTTGQTKLEAYKLDGSFLWRIDLGINIREGAHYTQFMVYDLDGDGRAEIACKTADGTIDGTGKVLGDPNSDYRNENGKILDGPEFLTVFDGRTGAELATVPYIPPRGQVTAWGDNTGNRVDRFLACIAYLDGQRPSLMMCRGYYTRSVLAAWNWRDGKLTGLWTFDSDSAPDGEKYRGQGNHNLSVGDVDGDGKDEIIYGACAIDDDGRGLYSTGLGHGDAMHLSDIDPDRPGLEVFGIHEDPRHPYGANLRDAATGKVLWGLQSNDAVRGVSMDIDPRHPGYECWAVGGGLDGLYNCKGRKIADRKPSSCNMGIWWDDDLLRELLNGTTIEKWNPLEASAARLLEARDFDCTRINGSKSNPCLCADILGDWREELILPTRDGSQLRIFTTTIPTTIRMPTLMHDPVYRLSVAWQNVGYNQPTQPGFYLGHDMKPVSFPAIQTPQFRN